jgi:DnaJ-class molecular chaperone
MAENPYDVLGVPRDADQAAIRKAYRALARKHHPDLNPGDKAAEAKFKAVSAANDLLSDPDKRAAFDRGEIDAEGQPRPERPHYRDFADGAAGRRYRPAGDASGHPAGGWGASEEELGDIFSTIFGAQAGAAGMGGGFAGASGAIRGRDELYGLGVDLLDVVNGATRRLTLPDGRTLDVKIPVGLEDGQTLRLRGQGSPGRNGGPAGDALIQIKVGEHPFFRREGNDIQLELPVTIQEAVLGARISVPTPAGSVAMTIPPRSDAGHKLRLRGRGVPAHGGMEAGDLYVTLRVVIGEPDPALEEFLRSWKPLHNTDPRRAMMGAA